MFDNPKDELQRLEEALLEEEERELPPQEDELDLDAILAEFGDEEPPRQRKRRNPAADFHRTVYDDETFNEDAAVPDNDPKPKGIGGLLVLAILELAGIVGVALWWAKWLL